MATTNETTDDERREPVGFYMSFSAPDGFLGGIIAYPANEFIMAVQKCHQMGINPGGEVLAVPLYEPPPDRHPRWTLLDYDRLVELDGADELTHITTPIDVPCACCGLPVMTGEDNHDCKHVP